MSAKLSIPGARHWTRGGMAAVALVAAAALPFSVQAADGGGSGKDKEKILYVAGTHPQKRPEAAPTVTTFDKGEAWWDRALAGISKPYPRSLRFLEAQGAWYTPWIYPGMKKPYDIRNLHD